MTYTKQQLIEMARQIAVQHGIDPDIFQRQINQESGFNPTIVSKAGAIGLGQLLPATAKNLGVVNPYDPMQNLQGAAKYMSNNLKNYGSYDLALANYNGGPGAVQYFQKHGGVFYDPTMPANSWAHQTGQYVQNILGGTQSEGGKKPPDFIPDSAMPATPPTQNLLAASPAPPPHDNWVDGLIHGLNQVVSPEAEAEPLPNNKPPDFIPDDAMPASTTTTNQKPPDFIPDDAIPASVPQQSGSSDKPPDFIPDDAMPATQPDTSVGGAVNRTLGLIGGIGGNLWQSGQQLVGKVGQMAQSGELVKDIKDITPVVLPAQVPANWGGGDPLTQVENKGQALVSGITGLDKGIRDIGQGIISAPADIANISQYITSGKAGNAQPLINLPDLNEQGQKDMAANPVAAMGGQLGSFMLPLTAAGKVGGVIGKAAEAVNNPILKAALTTASNESVLNPSIEAATGMAMDPGSNLTPQQRIESRLAQGALVGGGTAAGMLTGRVLKSVDEAAQVQTVMNSLRVTKETAQDIVASGNAKSAMDLASQVKPTDGTTLQPSVTSGFKRFDVIGDTKAALDNLTQNVGLDDATAQKVLQQAQTLAGQRQSVPHYVQVQRIDEQINQLLQRDGAPVPTSPTQVKILGGKKAMNELLNAPIVQRANQLADMIKVTPVEAKSILQGVQFPQEVLGQADYLTTPEALASKAMGIGQDMGGGLLSEGHLAYSTKSAGLLWRQIADNVPSMQGKIADSMSTLNGIQDNMVRNMMGWPTFQNKILRSIQDVGLDVAQWTKGVIDNGTLQRIREGDTAGLDPAIVSKLQPTADALNHFNSTHVIPALVEHINSTIPDAADWVKESDFNPATISNSQRGSQFYSWNYDALTKELAPTELQTFMSKYFPNFDPAEPTSLAAAYGNDYKQFLQSVENRQPSLSRDMPWLYDSAGKVKPGLLQAEPNNLLAMSNIRFAQKLDVAQLKNLMGERFQDFKAAFGGRTNLSDGELRQAYTDAVINGNTRTGAWSKFVGSLQKNEGKLAIGNVDPYGTMFSQIIDLAKKQHLEPIINTADGLNKLYEQRIATEFPPTTDPKVLASNEKKIALLREEQNWVNNIANMYRRMPTDTDKAMEEAINSLTGMAGKNASRTFRRATDIATSALSLMKLGFNIPTSMAHTVQQLGTVAAELDAPTWNRIYNEIQIKSPLKFLTDIHDEIKADPRLAPLVFNSEGLGTNSAFSGSTRFLGSRTLGNARDAAMYLFNNGLSFSKMINYKAMKEIGLTQGYRGQELNDNILKNMVRTKALPELDKIPLQSASSVGRLLLLMQSYMIRNADLSMQHWGSVLETPSPENIRKAMIYDFGRVPMFGVKSSIALGVLAKAYDTLNQTTDAFTGDHHDPVLDRLAAEHHFFGGGFFGALGIDTHFADSDISKLSGLEGGVAIKTLQDSMDAGRELAMAQRNNMLANEGPKVVNSFLKKEIPAYGRASQGADIMRTGSYLDQNEVPIISSPDAAARNRANFKSFTGMDNPLPQASPDTQKALDAANAAMGFKNMAVEQTQLNTHLLSSNAQIVKQNIEYLNQQVKEAVATQDAPALKQAMLGLVKNTLEMPDAQSVVKYASTLKLPSDNRFLVNMILDNPKEFAVLYQDPKLKPLLTKIMQSGGNK